MIPPSAALLGKAASGSACANSISARTRSLAFTSVEKLVASLSRHWPLARSIRAEIPLTRAGNQRALQQIEAARKAGDNGTEDLMKRILVGEEVHTDWLESQLELMKQIGEQNYLAQQLK